MDLVDAIRPTGAFRQCVPDDLGGPGVTATESLEVFEEFAYHDGSVGWCVAIASTTSLLASYLPDPHAGALFGDPGAIGGGFVVPRGRAVPVEGGLRVSGRWQWGSGTKHCTTIGGGCLVAGPDGRAEPRGDGLAAPFVFMDPDDIEFIETWDVAGLAGTGSVDFEARDVFVPEGRWAQIADGPGRDNTWSRFSFYGLLASGVAAAAVGIARRAVDELVELAGAKQPQGSSRTLAERAATQAETALAERAATQAETALAERAATQAETALAERAATQAETALAERAATQAETALAERAATQAETALAERAATQAETALAERAATQAETALAERAATQAETALAERAATQAETALAERAATQAETALAERAATQAETALAERAATQAETALAERAATQAETALAERAATQAETALAERAATQAETALAERAATQAETALAERAATQAETALAEARLAAAWSLMLDAVDDTFQSALAGQPSTVDQKRLIRLAATHATQTAADVAASMFTTAGGAAVYRTSPIQRCFRDTAVAAQHAMVAPRTLETAGRLRMGLQTDTTTL